MKLRFLPRGDAKVWVPGAKVMPGQPARYVGRRFDAATGTYPASSKPYECDSDTDEGRRLMKIARRDGDLIPADKETAQACGVALQTAPVSVPASDSPKPSTSKKGAE